MKTDVTELEESRARVDVEVPASDVERSLNRAAAAVGKEIRMPGFRKGKVPPQLVLQRIGRDAVLQQAIEDELPQWVERAMLETRLAAVGDPDLSLDELPAAGEPLRFAFEVGVRPSARLGDWRQGLEVGRREAEVPSADVDRVLDRLRDQHGRLEPVDRAAAEGDHVVIDYVGSLEGEPFEGGEERGRLIELGSGQFVPGFEEQLVGAEAGEERTVTVDFPEDYGAEDLAGRTAEFAVTVQAVNEKVLPELDDDLAQLASEFDTLGELREDVRSKLAERLEAEIDREFRQAVVDAVAEKAEVELPRAIVHSRAHEGWRRMERAMRAQGIDPERALAASGRSPEEAIAEAEPEAERELRREAVLAAVAEAEGIEVSDEELIEALASADQKRKPEKLLAELRRDGRDHLLRDELRMRKAVDVVVEAATPIPAERAEAREQIWTPEKESGGSGEGLWTPGSDEPEASEAEER